MKVVVVGAGYAGTTAANRLAKKVAGAEITVVNPRADFVERVRLHQQLAGTGEAATPLTGMLRDGITVRVGSVDKIGDGTLALADGDSLDFDYAVLAVGSTVRPLPGTVPVGTWEGAQRARTALAALPAGATVTVVGGGATGTETAAEVAEARSDLRVRVVGTDVAGNLSGAARTRMLTGLAGLGVDVVTGAVAEVDESDGTVRLASGTELASDLTLWAIVSGVPDLAARSGLDVAEDGRALVDPYLRSVSDERIFVVGDVAAVPGARFGCQSAGPQGKHAADVLARLTAGREPAPYPLRYVSRALSIGRKDAVIQFTHFDDSLRTAYVTGRTGTLIKELACRGGKFGARTGITG
ncbi:NAD(P)/FAD-dependent oxidoreductase [Streptomyces longispororuber]|uniref:NAD(P)/FAD-dependent oxidoreductase n=1 Tax=Streptomyces longispororuber TaxID=68230 RepID=UPI00210AE1B0|nr:FAD-dependent oxidoreductase [Streptomyces longispororuber]MCQ4206869.1 FAD-dependent oxidoreductase [Streptomyces longispororuber]